jgi:hypothetical protein
MAPGRIVIARREQHGPPGHATGHLWRASVADMTARLGFAPQKKSGFWAFAVCGVDFSVWSEKGSSAYGVFATSGPHDFFVALVAGTRMRHEGAPPRARF